MAGILTTSASNLRLTVGNEYSSTLTFTGTGFAANMLYYLTIRAGYHDSEQSITYRDIAQIDFATDENGDGSATYELHGKAMPWYDTGLFRDYDSVNLYGTVDGANGSGLTLTLVQATVTATCTDPELKYANRCRTTINFRISGYEANTTYSMQIKGGHHDTPQSITYRNKDTIQITTNENGFGSVYYEVYAYDPKWRQAGYLLDYLNLSIYGTVLSESSQPLNLTLIESITLTTSPVPQFNAQNNYQQQVEFTIIARYYSIDLTFERKRPGSSGYVAIGGTWRQPLSQAAPTLYKTIIKAEDWWTGNVGRDNPQVYMRLRSHETVPLVSEDALLELYAPPLLRSNLVTSDWMGDPNNYIAGVTSVTLTVELEPLFNTTIQSATMYINNPNSRSVAMTERNGVWTGTIQNIDADALNSGSCWIRMQAIDRRGQRFHGGGGGIVVKEHAAPTVTAEIYRCDENGDRDMAGGYISVTAWANSNPVEVGLANFNLTVFDGNGDIVDSVALTSGVRQILGTGNYDPDEGYALNIVATDNARTALTTTLIEGLPPVIRVINARDEGKGVAFGKLATEDDRVDSKWPIYSDGAIHAKTTSYVDYESDTVDRHACSAISTMSRTANGVRSFSRASILQWSPNTWDGNFTDNYELYRLPQVTWGMTENKNYDLLTSKTIGITHVYNVAGMGASAIKTLTVSNSTRGLILINGSEATHKGLYIFNTTSNGAISITPILVASAVTITSATNSITITKDSSSATAFATFMMFNGAITAEQ